MHNSAGSKNYLQKQKPMKKFIPIITGIAIVLIGCGICFKLVSSNNDRQNASPPPAPEVTATPATSEVNNIDYSPSDPSANDEIDKKKDSGSLAPTNGTPTETSVTITRASQAAEGTLQVRVLVSGTISGTCNLTATSGTTQVIKQVAVTVKGTYVTCDGFDIPKAELTSGNWNLEVTITNGSGTSNAANQAVTIN